MEYKWSYPQPTVDNFWYKMCTKWCTNIGIMHFGTTLEQLWIKLWITCGLLTINSYIGTYLLQGGKIILMIKNVGLLILSLGVAKYFSQ